MILIHDSPRYAVKSYGNGATLLLVNKTLDLDLLFQGDDATTFREEWDAAERADPEKLIADILDSIWRDYSTR